MREAEMEQKDGRGVNSAAMKIHEYETSTFFPPP